MSLPDFDITVDYENPMESLKQLFRFLRPKWDLKTITYDDMSTGYVNRNLKVYQQGRDEVIVVRLINGMNQLFIQSQKNIYTFLHQQKLGPELYCYINNGICLEYLSGTFMRWDTREGMYADNVWPLTAEKLAQYHSRDVFEKALEFGIPDKTKLPAENYTPIMDTLKATAPDSEFCQEIPSGEEFWDNRMWLMRTFEKIGAKLTFVHMDANPTNWLIKDNHAMLIDYDVTGIYYPSMDIAWFFLLHADWRRLDFDEYPSPEYQRKWLRRYLTKLRELDNVSDPVTDGDVERLREEVETFGRLGAYLQAVFAGIIIMLTMQKGGKEAVHPDTPLLTWQDFQRRKTELVNKGYE